MQILAIKIQYNIELSSHRIKYQNNAVLLYKEDRMTSRQVHCIEHWPINIFKCTNLALLFKHNFFCFQNFREQRIDGAGLPLLTEDHLTGMLQMKLGPALKLKAVLSRRLEPCAHCQAATATASPVAPPNNNLAPRVNGNALKSEPRSNTTSPS